MSGKLDTAALKAAGCRLWIAHYTDAAHPEYREQYDMWQYTSSGAVDGAEGRVDLSRQYTEPVKPQSAMVTLKIGPMSAGDLKTVKAKAQSLALPVREPGDGTLVAGPMSAGDHAALEAIAASLQLHVEVAEGQDEPEEDAQKKIAELTAKVDSLTAQVSTLTAQAEQTQLIISEYKEMVSKIKEIVNE